MKEQSYNTLEMIKLLHEITTNHTSQLRRLAVIVSEMGEDIDRRLSDIDTRLNALRDKRVEDYSNLSNDILDLKREVQAISSDLNDLEKKIRG